MPTSMRVVSFRLSARRGRVHQLEGGQLQALQADPLAGPDAQLGHGAQGVLRLVVSEIIFLTRLTAHFSKMFYKYEVQKP